MAKNIAMTTCRPRPRIGMSALPRVTPAGDGCVRVRGVYRWSRCFAAGVWPMGVGAASRGGASCTLSVDEFEIGVGEAFFAQHPFACTQGERAREHRPGMDAGMEFAAFA